MFPMNLLKLISLKDITQILLGFLIIHTIGNIYFAVSGTLPPPPSGILAGSPALTAEINRWAVIVGLIAVAILAYLLFFREGSEKINLKCVVNMIMGTPVLIVFVGLAMDIGWLAGAAFLGILILSYVNFFRKS